MCLSLLFSKLVFTLNKSNAVSPLSFPLLPREDRWNVLNWLHTVKCFWIFRLIHQGLTFLTFLI